MTTIATQSAPEGITFQRRGASAPASFNADDNSLEVVWTTGAPVERFGFFSGPFIETLDVTPQALRLDRLNSGAAVLDSHDMYELAAAIGSVIPGSVQIANGQGTARIALADTPDVADTVAKIRAGHLRTVSVGYFVHAYERLAGDDDELDELRAVDWEPIEISFVTVPADPGAQVRLKDDDMTRIIDNGARRATSRGTAAPVIINRDGGQSARNDDARDDARDQRRADPAHRERDRDDRDTRDQHRGGRSSRVQMATEDRIRSLCDRGNFSRDFERSLLEDHRDEPMTEAQLLRAVNDELMGSRPTGAIDARAGDIANPSGRTPGAARHGGDGMITAMEDALYSRMSGAKPADNAREFMGTSMADMARGLMERRGERVRWESPSRLMQRFGSHGTTDFPNLMQSVTNRYLVDMYNALPSPLKVLAGTPRIVPDFRRITALSMLPIGVLRPVGENAEFKRVSISEGDNGYKLATFGEVFTLTRQAFVNDDIGYFANLARMWARAATETEATQLAGLITGNGPVMTDAETLYSVAHSNVSPTGDMISPATLSAARLAMRSQRNPDGITSANVTPKYLVVGPAKETEAEQALAMLTAVGQPSEVNTFSGKLELIVEPRIPGNSWRLFADPALWPVLEYAQLAGQEALFTESRIGFDVDGFDFKARLDFGCGTVDFRGIYKNPGN